MLKTFLFFLCVVAAGVRLGFCWWCETKVAQSEIFCFGLVNCCRRRRAARQFLWCESNVAQSEIFCFGLGRYWRGRWVGGGGSAKNEGCVSTGYGQMAGLGDPGRARRGTKGREGAIIGGWRRMWTAGEGGDGDGGGSCVKIWTPDRAKTCQEGSSYGGFSLMRCNRPGEMG